MSSFKTLLFELHTKITSLLSSRVKANYLETERSAQHDFITGEAKVWDQIFRGNTWTKAVLRKDSYPVLYGDLTQLLLREGDRKKHVDRRNKPSYAWQHGGLR